MASSCLCLLMIMSSLLLLVSSTISITLTLSPTPKPYISSNKHTISNLIKSSLQRAHHLKNPTKSSYSSVHILQANSKAPLYPRSFGEYSVMLSFGCPPQTLPFIFDTGSSVVWAPCTRHYKCDQCSASGIDIAKMPTFKPHLSSSTNHLSCGSSECCLLTWPNVTYPYQCSSSKAKYKPCYYGLSYGDGSLTVGKAITENIKLSNKVYNHIIIGCSDQSVDQQEGIAGFGRSPTSLPNQLKLNKFAYCLVSHKFDDTPKHSELILGDTSELTLRLSYTPLLKSPTMSPFANYYYVELTKITVGRKHVKVPRSASIPDAQGNGGTIVDSGTTFTVLPSAVFDPIVNEFLAQLSPALRKGARIDEDMLCIDVSIKQKNLFPEVVFHLKGGVKMELLVSNYVRHSEILCLPFVNETIAVAQGGSGPAIIVGNYHQQNVYIEFDLKNERLGLKKHKCG